MGAAAAAPGCQIKPVGPSSSPQRKLGEPSLGSPRRGPGLHCPAKKSGDETNTQDTAPGVGLTPWRSRGPDQQSGSIRKGCVRKNILQTHGIQHSGKAARHSGDCIREGSSTGRALLVGTRLTLGTFFARRALYSGRRVRIGSSQCRQGLDRIILVTVHRFAPFRADVPSECRMHLAWIPCGGPLPAKVYLICCDHNRQESGIKSSEWIPFRPEASRALAS